MKLLLSVISIALLFSCQNAPKEKIEDKTPDSCTEYACPMHPDHTSVAPASCPVCGMEMEKVTKKGAPCDSTKHV